MAGGGQSGGTWQDTVSQGKEPQKLQGGAFLGPSFLWASGWGRALGESLDALAAGLAEQEHLPFPLVGHSDGRLFQPKACNLGGDIA